MNPTAFIHLQHRAQFERSLSLAVVAGAAAGLLSAVLQGSALGGLFAWAVGSAVVFAFAGGDRFDRWAVRLSVPLLLAAAFLLERGVDLLACGALGGPALVLASVGSRGAERQVAQLRPGAAAYLVAAALGAALLWGGIEVAQVLSRGLRDVGVPWLLSTSAAGAVSALFLGLASLPGHLLLQADPVEVRAGALLVQLTPELGALCERMLTSYRRCGELLGQLPRNGARAELANVITRSTGDALELVSDWSEVEAQLEESGAAELKATLSSLESDAARATDALARTQLTSAARSLSDELARLGELAQRRERVMARLKATCAELDRTRLSLLSLRSARSHAKATELLALSRKLRSLSALETTRGELESAVATGAELHHVEALCAEGSPVSAVTTRGS